MATKSTRASAQPSTIDNVPVASMCGDAQAVTKELNFFSTVGFGEEADLLFSVRPGISAEVALNSALMLMHTMADIQEVAADDTDASAKLSWALNYLHQMSMAAVESALKGIEARGASHD